MKQIVALCASTGLACAVWGQESEVPAMPIGPVQHIGTPFADRSLIPVYGGEFVSCPGSVFTIGHGSSYVVEDVSFHPGPYGDAFLGSRVISRVGGMFQTSGWSGTPTYPDTGTPQFFITQVFEFWDAGSFTAAPMLSASTPFATRSIPTNFGSGYAWQYYATPDPFVEVDDRVNIWVAIRAIDPFTGARIFDGATALQQPTGQTGIAYGVWLGRVGDVCVGHTEPDFGRDQNPTSALGGTFAGGSTYLIGSYPGNANDRRRTSANPAQARSITLSLWGGECVDCGLPPSAESVCPVLDGLTTRTWTPSQSIATVKWYQICLNAPVSDEALRFLSIDTEGSSQPMALGLYDARGVLLATDSGSGSEANSQLTFGMGRSAGVGNGAQYDGRDGQLPAGTYYLAVAGPSAHFQAWYVVHGTMYAEYLPVTLNVHTNANSGGNLPPLVAPIINHADFADPWSFPNTDSLQGESPATAPGPAGDDSTGVLWTRFTLSPPGAAVTQLGSTYIDIDSGAAEPSDSLLYVFNSAGDLVAASDDQSPTASLPLLSFGASSPARSMTNGYSRGVNNDTMATWAGQSGWLQPGTYFVASAARPADVLTGQDGGLPTLGAERRFHVRGRSSSSIPHTLRFYTGQGTDCDPIDFNNDGLFPDTFDIADFLEVFGGGACSNDPHCGDIDFNNDGLFPDTLDIDALLSVFSGGPCLR